MNKKLIERITSTIIINNNNNNSGIIDNHRKNKNLIMYLNWDINLDLKIILMIQKEDNIFLINIKIKINLYELISKEPMILKEIISYF